LLYLNYFASPFISPSLTQRDQKVNSVQLSGQGLGSARRKPRKKSDIFLKSDCVDGESSGVGRPFGSWVFFSLVEQRKAKLFRSLQG
jgi:hypothetical protein